VDEGVGLTKVYVEDLENLQPDQDNPNKGTERGAYVIRKSLEATGAGRSLVIDKDGTTAAGNKTLEALADLGFKEVIIVETDGTQAVAVKRTDWDLSDPSPSNPARLYAYYDNRASEVGFELDIEQISEDVMRGVDLTDMYRDKELDKIIAQAEALPLDDMEEASELEEIHCPKCGFTFSV
jgi:hypothetical protein